MSDEAAFLAKIIETPDDDTVRLVFADWLDENGQPERAEFVRVQVKLALMPEPEEKTIGGFFATKRDRMRLVCVECRRTKPPGLCAFHELKERERELLGDAKPGEIRHRVWEWFYAPLPHVEHRTIRRGFIECVICTAADWLKNGDAIRAKQPVTKVVLTTLPEIEIDPIHNDGDEFAASLLHRDSWTTFPLGSEEGLPEALLKIEWPGVTFVLPNVADLDQGIMPDGTTFEQAYQAGTLGAQLASPELQEAMRVAGLHESPPVPPGAWEAMVRGILTDSVT